MVSDVLVFGVGVVFGNPDWRCATAHAAWIAVAFHVGQLALGAPLMALWCLLVSEVFGWSF